MSMSETQLELGHGEEGHAKGWCKREGCWRKVGQKHRKSDFSALSTN